MFKKEDREKVYKGLFKNKLLIAATTLIGTIVGAGILGIPYVVAESGIAIGFLWIVLLGLTFLLMNLFTGEVILRTKKHHQLTGYAEKYLGKWGKRGMTLSMLISIYGALTAYLIGSGATLQAIFSWGSPLWYSLIFFVITAVIVVKGIKATGRTELILISLLFLIVIVIGLLSVANFNAANFVPHSFAKFFVPYGVVLFAFMGMPAIPEITQELKRNKKQLKKAIIIGSVAPIILYLVFTVIILALIGVDQFSLLAPNERIATIALSVYGNPVLGVLANILAVLAMFTSFLTLALALTSMYHYDYNVKKWLALVLTLSLPLLIVLFNITTFLIVLGITGALAGGLEAIIVQLMYWKAKTKGNRKPEYSLPKYKLLGILFIILFILGILISLYSQFF
ncbi:amino acid permease [Candidatus Woesearchaeota archaeon]|jgi:tyrosine-specific transport protein|nr:amino acid permease [Candidatus Woesearchaeota archaeon]MBT5739487.1 amino acid permease [Candidatus Woesearchaeota archaeon]